jgi:hypothetical protein
MRATLRHLPVRLAIAAVVLSLAVLGSTIRRAVEVEQALGALDSSGQPTVTDVSPAAAPAAARVLEAVESDPFHPERRRPADRFRLPGEAIATASDPAPPAPAPLVLLGTVVLAEGRGFAMCQQGSDQPRIVRVGESLGDYTLRTIEQGRAVFTTRRGEKIELRVPKPGNQSE